MELTPLLPAFVGTPERNKVYNCDALTLLRALPSGSVQLIATDPPYNGVKDDAWDNQWRTDADYLSWLDGILREMKRVLAPNGSLYLFASPRMAARVEIAVGNHFNTLTRITWQKPPYSTKAEMFDKDTMRAYFPASEAVIFAEQYGVQSFLRERRLASGVSSNQAAELFPSETGGLTGCVRNWELGLNLPSREQYEVLSTLYKLPHYDDAIRPFTVTAADPYTDVWTFATVNTYPGKHPCEKPLDMMRHIVRASSRPGDLVLDCFSGSGVTLQAAKLEGRDYVGCDMDADWAAVSRNRVREPWTPMVLKRAAPLDDLPLFAQAAANE